MGEVWQAEDQRLKRLVALKLLRTASGQASQAETGQRFLREARSAAALNHPGIATIYEIDQLEHAGARHSFIAMEYVPGLTLGDYARRHALTIAEITDIIRQVAEALAVAHETGIVHRDIKPSNLMITEGGTVKVLDFGLAKLTERHGDTATLQQGEDNISLLAASHHPFVSTSSLTEPGLVLGTFSYMSPEQASGATVDQRSDIFSLGVVLYELLTGRLPFTGENVMALLHQVLHSEPHDAASLNPQVTPQLQTVLRRMLARDKTQRYQTMREVLADLSGEKELQRIYEFGSFRLNVAERQLTEAGQPVALKPKVFDLLVVLIQNAGRLLEKDQLYQALWPDSIVEDVNLNVNVSALRKALGDEPHKPAFIETVPKKGYRFIASVRETATPVASLNNDLFATRMLKNIDQSASQPSAPTPATPAQAAEFPALPRQAEVTVAESSHDNSPEGSKQKRLSHRALVFVSIALLLIVTASAFALRFAWRKEQNVHSLAVLPFRTLTGEMADQALGLGMTDTLTTRLSGVHSLTTRPTSAVLKYSGDQIDPLSAGRELGVDAILDGRLQRDGKMIRVTAQLLRVSDGATLWSGRFDDFFTNVFALQDSISEKMVEQLSMQLTQSEQQQMMRRYTENTEAYQLYLLGRYHHFKLSRENLQKAMEYYHAALEKDPDYPMPYAAMTGIYLGWVNAGSSREQNRELARTSADKALRLAPDLADAYEAVGTVRLVLDWDFNGAQQALARAIELNPGNADVWDSYAMLLSVLERHDEAIQASERAQRIDPTSAYFATQCANYHNKARHYDEAIAWARKALDLEPQFAQAWSQIAFADLCKGDYAGVLAIVQKATQQNTMNDANSISALADFYAGRTETAESYLNDFEHQPSTQGWNIFHAARVHVALGHYEKALQLLEKCYQQREIGMLMIQSFPEFDRLENDPRYRDLLHRIGLPARNHATGAR